MVLDLNFPCKYVVFWCFTFLLFFQILPFFTLGTVSKKVVAAFKEKTVSEKPENKKQKYPNC